VEQVKVLCQVEIGCKENEISKAPQALKSTEISQKVVTGDALHTQRGLSTQILEAHGNYLFPVKENQPQLHKNIQALFAPEYPKPGFGKIETDFLTAQKVNKGHGRIETRILTTSEMLNPYSSWLRSIVWNVNSSGGAMGAVTAVPVKSNMASPVSRGRKPPQHDCLKFAARIGVLRWAYTTVAM
jgi:predicted transposase YbfD/YdcC